MFTVSSGFTSEQILDALDRCSKNSYVWCDGCPYRTPCLKYEGTAITTDAAELIRMLTTRINVVEKAQSEIMSERSGTQRAVMPAAASMVASLAESDPKAGEKFLAPDKTLKGVMRAIIKKARSLGTELDRCPPQIAIQAVYEYLGLDYPSKKFGEDLEATDFGSFERQGDE